MSGSVWETLGIAPTTDEREIRRGYSRALKTIDVDRDAAAFVALREAYDVARDEARHAAWDEAEADDVVEPVEIRRVEAVDEPPAAVPEDDFAAIYRLIYGEAAREAIFAPVQRHAEAILADPRMEGIGFAAEVEDWFAHTILGGIPRSNALLAIAINAFGWFARAEHWNCPPAIRGVVQRYRDCLFLDDLPKGGAWRAWQVLAAPPAPRRPHDADPVRRLLETLRAEHPTLLSELDADTVAGWDAMFEKAHNAPHRRARRSVRAWSRRVVRPILPIVGFMGRWRVWLLLFILLRVIIALGQRR